MPSTGDYYGYHVEQHVVARVLHGFHSIVHDSALDQRGYRRGCYAMPTSLDDRIISSYALFGDLCGYFVDCYGCFEEFRACSLVHRAGLEESRALRPCHQPYAKPTLTTGQSKL